MPDTEHPPAPPETPTVYSMAEMAKALKTSRTSVFRIIIELELQPDVKSHLGYKFYNEAKKEQVAARLAKRPSRKKQTLPA